MPATPDLDPGYHTGPGLCATQTIGLLLAREGWLAAAPDYLEMALPLSASKMQIRKVEAEPIFLSRICRKSVMQQDHNLLVT